MAMNGILPTYVNKNNDRTIGFLPHVHVFQLLAYVISLNRPIFQKLAAKNAILSLTFLFRKHRQHVN